jgi:hypothetical protein
LLKERQLLYFRPFYFQNGNTPQNKFFVVLKIIENTTIVASLPTKINNAPSLIDKSHGCVTKDDRMFNCYVFEQGRPICENGFCFDLQTHMYGNQVSDYTLTNLTKNNTIREGIEFDIVGILTVNEFSDIYKCLSENNSTRNKIKKMLAA